MVYANDGVNKLVVRLDSLWFRKQAYQILYMKPSKRRKNATDQYNQMVSDFWWAVLRLPQVQALKGSTVTLRTANTGSGSVMWRDRLFYLEVHDDKS